MKTFKNKTAVITGAASGIGRAIAEQCVRDGAHVVLADIEAPALRTTERALTAPGAQVLAVQTDVSDSQAIERLADAAYSRFGAVHLLFNNAGVGAGTTVWESTLADWTISCRAGHRPEAAAHAHLHRRASQRRIAGVIGGTTCIQSIGKTLRY